MAMELLTLKFMLLLFGEGGNLYNLDEMILYKTMKKNFFQLIQYLRKVRYHLIVAISVELPIYKG